MMGAAIVAVFLVLAGACSPGVAGVDGITGVEGLSYEEAIAAAREHVGPRATLMRAAAGQLGDFDGPGEVVLPEEPRDRLVWAISFDDLITPYCPVLPNGQLPSGCEEVSAETLVVIDYRTGEFLYSSSEGRGY